MIDMSSWDNLNVDVVTDLHLDPRNVRLELPFEVPEVDIIHDLFHNEKVLSLVENITKLGFFTHEVPIVLFRNGQLVVVEGNRRVAALKAIQNPFLAGDYQARVTRLVQDFALRDQIRRIVVKKAPSQDEADQLIAALHTGNQRVAWTPSRQAAFFQAQIDAGKTAEDLIDQYPTVDVRKFIIRSRILQLFRDVHYTDPHLQDYVRKRNFPVSVLARLYDNDKFLELVQIEVDPATASVALIAEPEVFAVVAEKIVADIKRKHLNTRRLNSTTSDSYTEYMDKLRALLEDFEESRAKGTSSQGSSSSGGTTVGTSSEHTNGTTAGTAGHGSGDAGGGSSPSGAGTTPGSGSTGGTAPPKQGAGNGKTTGTVPRKRNYLSTENIVVAPAYPPPVHLIFKELSSINIQKYPNATFDLIRTFLEKSIKAFAELQGVDIRTRYNVKGYVYLAHCLNWLEDHLKASGTNPYIQVITKVKSGKLNDFVPSMTHLNAINHNHHIYATTDDVRECWQTIEGLLKEVLKP